MSMGRPSSPDGLMSQPSGLSVRAETFAQRLSSIMPLISATAQHLSFAAPKPQKGDLAAVVHDCCAAKKVKLAGKASVIQLLCTADEQMMIASVWWLYMHAMSFLLHQTLATTTQLAAQKSQLPLARGDPSKLLTQAASFQQLVLQSCI